MTMICCWAATMTTTSSADSRSKASKSTTGRGALRGIQDLSAGSGSHTRSLGGVGSAAGLGLNSAMMKPGQTIRVKAGGHVGKSANNGVPTHRK
eukprot:gene29634-38758_t